MGILDFLFKKKESQETINEEIKESEPEIPKDKFVDESDPISTINTYNIEFGSKLPIDVIYSFLKEDYETKAYNDALTNPYKSYKEKNIAIIKSNLEIKFKQVSLKYEDMLRDIDFHIQTRGDAGLTDLVELLKSRRQTYSEHSKELYQMKTDLNNEESYMMGVFQSYEVGFTRGLASLSLHNLRLDNN